MPKQAPGLPQSAEYTDGGSGKPPRDCYDCSGKGSKERSTWSTTAATAHAAAVNTTSTEQHVKRTNHGCTKAREEAVTTPTPALALATCRHRRRNGTLNLG